MTLTLIISGVLKDEREPRGLECYLRYGSMKRPNVSSGNGPVFKTDEHKAVWTNPDEAGASETCNIDLAAFDVHRAKEG